MYALTLEIGNDLKDTIASLLAFLMLIYTSWRSHTGSKASTEAVKQLNTNGGFTAFDKIMTKLDEHSARLDNLESHSIRTREGEPHE